MSGTDERFTVVALEDVEGYGADGRAYWHMLRSGLGISAFGINAWRATAADQELIGEHDELSDGAGGHEEAYVVASGHATFTVDGTTLAAPAGTVVFVRDPTLKRAAVANEADTVVLVAGGKRGEAFSVSPWEKAGEALRFWTTQDWDGAVEFLTDRLADDPDNENTVYNLACAESRAGQADAAIGHLERAIALRPGFAESARDDPDFAPIRDDPRFPTHA